MCDAVVAVGADAIDGAGEGVEVGGWVLLEGGAVWEGVGGGVLAAVGVAVGLVLG
jgi:hypothetical protein